ncbi:MAG: hypothetical protein HC880_19695, partial [Bacteroidia bacterium]|nr:hypothetical protein [Bacteroidia bacterium]
PGDWSEKTEDIQEEQWMASYEHLRAFYQAHGHCRVSYQSENHKSLAAWVSHQRKRESALSEEKKRLLEALNFPWSWRIVQKKEDWWMKRYEELKAFYQEHGHCRVPLQYPPNQRLGDWVHNIKTRQQVTPEQKALLDAIHFSWVKKTVPRKQGDEESTK